VSASPHWVVLLAVKPLPLAKSRLDRADRSELTLAMAADTAEAATRVQTVDAVVVVTDDRDARALLEPFALVVPDAPNAGLNPALAYAAAQATQRWPNAGVAVLAADLPALRHTAGDLEVAIRTGVGPRTAHVLAQEVQLTLGWQTARVNESAPPPRVRPRR
jgi:2-phospho-L-lactate guanylyltransferase (CobY/MobA/RfbA family)